MHQFTERQVGGVAIVAAEGAVDMLTAPQLQETVSAVLQRKPAGLIIDMSDVEFLGSAGMQVLVIARNELDDDTRFAVVADGPATSRPLKITGITEFIDVFSSLDDALTKVTG